MALQVKMVELKKVGTPLVGIRGRSVRVEGSVKLPITLGDKDKRRTLRQSFMVAKIDTLYNAIFNKPLLNELCAILSPRYLMVKCKTEKGITLVRRDQVEARKGVC